MQYLLHQHYTLEASEKLLHTWLSWMAVLDVDEADDLERLCQLGRPVSDDLQALLCAIVCGGMLHAAVACNSARYAHIIKQLVVVQACRTWRKCSSSAERMS